MVKLVFKVGCSCMAVSKPRVRITSKSTQLFDKGLGQTATSAWKCPKLNFEALSMFFCIYAHTQTQRHCFKGLCMHVLGINALTIYHGMHWTSWYRSNSLSHWKARIWLPVAFKKIPHPLKPTETAPSSERSAYPLQNCLCFSPLTSGLESVGHKNSPSHRPWIEAHCSKFQLAWKWVGLRMPKGSLSRVP